MFDPASVAYPFRQDFDRRRLKQLLGTFVGVVKREQDRSLATRLEAELLLRDPPGIERETFKRLAKWCKSDGHLYWDGMDVARKISVLLFGRVLERAKLGV